MIKGMKDLLRGIPEVLTRCGTAEDGTRVYFSTVPENPTYPYIRFVLPDDSPLQDFDGLSGLTTSLCQINIYDPSAVEGKKLKTSILKFIDGKHNSTLSDDTQVSEFSLTGGREEPFRENEASKKWIYDFQLDYEITHEI